MTQLTGLAVVWLRKEDWPRWLAIDPDFQPDYNHWLKRMEEALQHLKAEGAPFEKVVVNPDEFMEWSRVNGRKVNSQSRAAYAAITLANRQETRH